MTTAILTNTNVSLNSSITISNKTDLAHNTKSGITHNANDVIDGLLVVFSNHVANEVEIEATIIKNRRVFNKSDAKVLTKLAKDKLNGEDLTDEQVADVQRRMPKYTRQIMNTKISNVAISKQNGIYMLN